MEDGFGLTYSASDSYIGMYRTMESLAGLKY